MNRLTTLAALVAAAVIATHAESAWPDETTANGSAAPAEQTPAPASPAVPGGYPQTWQQPPRWRAPQQFYGHLPPRYPPVGQYQAFPAQPATAPAVWENPLSAELKQAQAQLAAKSSELDEAQRMLEQLRAKLQESLAAEARLTDKVTYSTREQNALRVRVTDLVKTLNAANATLEQQHQLINDHGAQNQALTAERDQLHSKLAALQSELQAATQALAQARTRAGTAGEALGAARDELNKLEAGLGRQENRPQSGRKSMGPD
jgi:outer membrane murein-binding lipoprotein Lpp